MAPQPTDDAALREARKKNRAAELERCNRIAGHAGPHRVIDAYTFATLREWER